MNYITKMARKREGLCADLFLVTILMGEFWVNNRITQKSYYYLWKRFPPSHRISSRPCQFMITFCSAFFSFCLVENRSKVLFMSCLIFARVMGYRTIKWSRGLKYIFKLLRSVDEIWNEVIGLHMRKNNLLWNAWHSSRERRKEKACALGCFLM